MMLKLTWRRTQLVHPDLPTRANDWVLVDETNEIHAHLWDSGTPDLIGQWRWRVFIDHKMQEGSARSGTEARETCERLLAEFLQAQMVKLP
jgi:hypothetical protein